jgi:hypothetical protein
VNQEWTERHGAALTAIALPNTMVAVMHFGWLVLAGLAAVFGQGTASSPVDPAFQGIPSMPEVEPTGLPEAMPAPELSMAAAGPLDGAAPPMADPRHLSGEDGHAVLVARSLHEKYRAFRESLTTP